jgi:hypothetical protein
VCGFGGPIDVENDGDDKWGVRGAMEDLVRDKLVEVAVEEDEDKRLLLRDGTRVLCRVCASDGELARPFVCSFA